MGNQNMSQCDLITSKQSQWQWQQGIVKTWMVGKCSTGSSFSSGYYSSISLFRPRTLRGWLQNSDSTLKHQDWETLQLGNQDYELCCQSMMQDFGWSCQTSNHDAFQGLGQRLKHHRGSRLQVLRHWQGKYWFCMVMNQVKDHGSSPKHWIWFPKWDAEI